MPMTEIYYSAGEPLTENALCQAVLAGLVSMKIMLTATADRM